MFALCRNSAACASAEELVVTHPGHKHAAFGGPRMVTSAWAEEVEAEEQQLPLKLEGQLIRQKTQELDKARRGAREEERHILERQERLRRQAESLQQREADLRQQAEALERARRENNEEQRRLLQEEQHLQLVQRRRAAEERETHPRRPEEQQQQGKVRRQQDPRPVAEKCRHTAHLDYFVRKVRSMARNVKGNSAGTFAWGLRHPFHALHAAVRRANAEAVEVLLAAGADRNLRDSAKRTPLELAKLLDKDGSHKRVIAALSR